VAVAQKINGHRRRRLVLHIVGARPNYMKVAPVYAELERRGRVDQRLIHTGQHYDPLVRDVFFDELPLPSPHVQMEVGSGGHGEQTARALEGLEAAFIDFRPDLVLVPGDVNSTLAGALAAAKLNIPVCHLEAGLRSFDLRMPEEHNRKLTDHLSSLLLTHSLDAHDNLEREGINGDSVVFVGNTMIDTLLASVDAARDLAVWRELGVEPGDYLLVTLHRPALVDDRDLLQATIEALEVVSESIPVVFPAHPRTHRRLETLGLVPGRRVHVVEPQAYRRFLSLEVGAAAVLTDSGGVQEETTALGVPCFTLRENTERPVTVTHGTNVVLGLDPRAIAEIPDRLRSFAPSAVPPFWDGRAGARAAATIEKALGIVRTSRAPLALARRPD
jgi:UDP-N-acetylglucosamine 2-epimerase (non-hydrolysing)